MESDRIRTSIETEFEIGGKRAQGKIKNISEGGLFVGTAALPEEGDNLELRFRAPDGSVVSLSRMVWWTRAPANTGQRQAPGFGMRVLDDNEVFRGMLSR